MFQKKYYLVLSLIVFYHNITSFVFKVIGYIIYSFIDTLICLDYLGIVQIYIFTYNNKFEN